VLWVGANECDLCILSYELPGIDGLETLARMRNRKPDLPIIMISGSTSQDVAIAAFRSGVVDFVRTKGDYTRMVTSLAERTASLARGEEPSLAAPTVDPRLEHLPPERLAPTYQNRLRVIGRQLDIYQYRSVSVIEVAGGFLVRAAPPGTRTPDALEFPDRDFPRFILTGIECRNRDNDEYRKVPPGELAPTGYEDLLRALGHRLDEMSAESIVIVELKDVIAVGGRGHSDLSLAPTIETFQLFLREHEIEYMLNEAFLRRGKKMGRVATSQKPAEGGLRNILKRLN
jgi:hypothetical protein